MEPPGGGAGWGLWWGEVKGEKKENQGVTQRRGNWYKQSKKNPQKKREGRNCGKRGDNNHLEKTMEKKRPQKNNRQVPRAMECKKPKSVTTGEGREKGKSAKTVNREGATLFSQKTKYSKGKIKKNKGGVEGGKGSLKHPR